MTPKRQRLIFVLASVVCICAAVLLIIQALRNEVVYFYTPSELTQLKGNLNHTIRIGGLVEEGSLVRGKDNRITFLVTDGETQMKVNYQGLLPNLFREGQGIVAQGTLQPDGHFKAVNLLAKHDENYMPPEVADALKKNGRWEENGKKEKKY